MVIWRWWEIILVSKFGSRGVFLHHPLEFKERPNWNSVGASNLGRLIPSRFLNLTVKLLSWYSLAAYTVEMFNWGIKTLVTFHYTCCSKGILIMFYYNQHFSKRKHNPKYALNNQGVFHCSINSTQNCWEDSPNPPKMPSLHFPKNIQSYILKRCFGGHVLGM